MPRHKPGFQPVTLRVLSWPLLVLGIDVNSKFSRAYWAMYHYTECRSTPPEGGADVNFPQYAISFIKLSDLRVNEIYFLLRNLILNLGLFAAGVWLARNLSDIDLMAPQPGVQPKNGIPVYSNFPRQPTVQDHHNILPHWQLNLHPLGSPQLQLKC